MSLKPTLSVIATFAKCMCIRERRTVRNYSFLQGKYVHHNVDKTFSKWCGTYKRIGSARSPKRDAKGRAKEETDVFVPDRLAGCAVPVLRNYFNLPKKPAIIYVQIEDSTTDYDSLPFTLSRDPSAHRLDGEAINLTLAPKNAAERQAHDLLIALRYWAFSNHHHPRLKVLRKRTGSKTLYLSVWYED